MKILHLPVTEEEVRALRVGDAVYVSGDMVTGRDRVHERVVKEGKMPETDKPIWRAAPFSTPDP